MQTRSYLVAPGLYLVCAAVSAAAPAKVVEIPTNHILVIDCSGSMSWDLPKMREQLKKKLPKLLRKDDTVSIIWFSGRGQFGTLLEAEPVATLSDLQQVNQAIDRWLTPIGLTGFKEPLQEASKLVERISTKRPNTAFSLFFLSDGCDNVWQRGEIITAVETVAGKLSSTTIVEYGYYADRPLLTRMAEKAGGNLIFAQNFDTYAPQLEGILQKKVSGGKKVEITVEGDAIGGFVYALQDGDLITFAIESGKANIPEGVSSVWYVSPSAVGSMEGNFEIKNGTHPALDAGYAAISLFAVRMLPDVVLPLLKATGDVEFIEKFGGLFGKQKYTEFMEAAKVAAFDPSKRLTKGYDPSKVPADDAFTVLDLLRLLASDDQNRVLLDDPHFKYNRIGRKQLDAAENLTAEEQAEITRLTAEMSKTRDPKQIADFASKIAAVTANKKPALKFVEDAAAKGAGYTISNLTYNSERPNISILVRKSGTVDVSDRIPDNLKGRVPNTVSTYVYRNYAIVSDGLVNVEVLPVRISRETAKQLEAAHLPDGCLGVLDINNQNNGDFLINLKALPVINRKMVQATSAKEMFELEYRLQQAKAAQKVYNTIKKDKFPRKAEGFAAMYGDEAAAWLQEQGITDYNGFNPSRTQAESTDFYMGKELSIGLKGLSSLPKLSDVRDRLAAIAQEALDAKAGKVSKKKASKLTAGMALMVSAVQEVDDFLASAVYQKAANKDKLFETWLDGQLKDSQTKARDMMRQMAQIIFCVVVGQIWFKEFHSLDEHTMNLTIDGQDVACSVEMREVQIKI